MGEGPAAWAVDGGRLMLLPIADHGSLLTALPFVAPALLILVGLLALVMRDRLRRDE